MPFCTTGIRGGASFHAPPSLGGAWVHAPPFTGKQPAETGSLLFCNAGDAVTCKTTKETQQHRQLILVFISDLFFSGLLDPLRVLLPVGSASLQIGFLFFYFKWPVAGPWSCLSMGAG